jgi:hypothetical protein
MYAFTTFMLVLFLIRTGGRLEFESSVIRELIMMTQA